MAINGYIPQIENQSKHRKFAQKTDNLDYILLKIDDAKALLKRGITAENYASPDTKIITTTTIMDEKLEDLNWDEELQIIEKFRPDYHIPTDVPVYKEYPEQKRFENIRLYLQGLIYIEERTEIELLPLIKGETRYEREYSKDIFKEYDHDFLVFYATQLVITGRKYSKIIGDIHKIAQEFQDKQILVMGLQAPRYVEIYPSNIKAVSGQKWLRKADFSDDTDKLASSYNELRKDIDEALRGPKQKSLWSYRGANA